MDSLPAVSVILLLLTTGPLLGWTLPTGSGEIPEAIDEENVLDSRNQERPAIADPGVIPLEVSNVDAPLDVDAESEEGSTSGEDADEERGEPLNAEEERGGPLDVDEERGEPLDVDEERVGPLGSDEEREGPLDAEEERGGPLDVAANADTPRYQTGLLNRLFPNVYKNLYHKDAFDRIGDVFMNFEFNMNEIIRKAMNEATHFNGTTTNSTKVVEDDKGNKYKVDTVIKKGDHNQTMIMEIIESMPPTTNRTKRSNWSAEPYQ